MRPHNSWKGTAGGESGQAVVMVVAAMVGLLAMAGFVIDLGMAYRTHRALQASADAAALAGAQELPAQVPSETAARAFGTAGKNPIKGVAVTEAVSSKCLVSIPGCRPVNAVSVQETATVKTFFAKVVGINSIQLKAHATACSPCGTKPVDIMLVLDRTGSMCQDSLGRNDPNCTDLKNAKDGIRTFLSYFDSRTAWAGLAVFPPAPSVKNRCSSPSTYATRGTAYVVVPMSQDYRNPNGTLNTSSNLLTTLGCTVGNGTTSYASAIEAAQAELQAHGRPDIPDVIVFFTDGAANTGPSYLPEFPTSSLYRTQPCHQGITSANAAKATGTTIYSIGYALDDDTGGCKNGVSGKAELPTITPYDALRGIASDPTNFLNRPTPGDLQGIYSRIAEDISHGTSSLVDDSVN